MRPQLPTRACLLVLLLASVDHAQWDSIPWSGGSVLWRESYVAYPSAAGVQAFSATGQRWALVSPPGSTVVGQGETLLVTREPGGLRAWSALRNDSAALALPAGATAIVADHAAIAWDPASGGNAVLHAYSPFLNAWTSFQSAAPAASVQPAIGFTAAAVGDANGYHAWSARTGLWASLAIVGAGKPAAVGDLVLVDFDDGPGFHPQQIGAFSAHRGTWAVSDPYTSTVGHDLKHATELAIVRVKTADPQRFAYSAFSALDGAWVTSSVTHAVSGAASATTTAATLAVVGDPAATSTWQAFSAGGGAWSQLGGAGLSIFGASADVAMVRDPATGVVHAVSGLVQSGFVPAAIGAGASFASQAERFGLVHSAAGTWTFSATAGTWTGPVVEPAGALDAHGAAVYGFHAPGTAPRAYSARWSQWVAHPTAVAATGDTISAQGSALAFVERQLGDPDVVRPFDERLKRWGTPLALGPIGSYDAVTVGGTVVVCRPDFFHPDGAVYAWSGHRDDWSATAGVGPPATAIQAYGDVAWFRDQDQRLWAFGARERTYVHDAWPDRPGYATSGPGPAGSALQRLRVSLRGEPGAEALVLFASLQLAPAPFAVPGVGGLGYLHPAGAVLLASLGVVDADGVLDVGVPLAGALPPGLSAWLQTVEVDLGSLQASFAGRAAQAWVF